MKCQKCSKAVTLHITEVLGEEQFEVYHLCEDCAHEFLNDSQQKPVPDDDDETGSLNQQQCPICGLKFVEFRNSGRLGCPHDYEVFADDLTPLLENIHGETRHAGKTPRQQPQARQSQTDLTRLRRQLQTAVTDEAYEEAARLRDEIRIIEQG